MRFTCLSVITHTSVGMLFYELIRVASVNIHVPGVSAVATSMACVVDNNCFYVGRIYSVSSSITRLTVTSKAGYVVAV